MLKGGMPGNQDQMNRMPGGGPMDARQPQPPKQSGPLNVDDMVIPAITANGAGNQMTEYPDEDPRNQELAVD